MATTWDVEDCVIQAPHVAGDVWVLRKQIAEAH